MAHISRWIKDTLTVAVIAVAVLVAVVSWYRERDIQRYATEAQLIARCQELRDAGALGPYEEPPEWFTKGLRERPTGR